MAPPDPAGAGVIEQVVPPWVAAVETRQDGTEDHLYPAEREVIANAVSKRRAEFSTVRRCARTALGQLGVPPAPIVPGERGAPTWPVGVVGSMTHCAGYRAAAVAASGRAISIGLDAEPHEPLPDGVLEIVATADERERLGTLATADESVHWDRMLFTMKESVYKAWFPITGRWLDFHEASIVVDAARGRFLARLLVPSVTVAGTELTAFSGRFLIADGLVISAIVLERAHRSAPVS